ncbi:hypothetical protein K360107B91_40260 [Enterocloster bolteae]
MFASFITFAGVWNNAQRIPVGVGVADTTGNIVLTDSTCITLAPGYYCISYQVSSMLADAGYMQITPVYNGSSHIEYGIYFWTANARSSAFGASSLIVEVPQTTTLYLYFNSNTRAQEGTVTMVIFKLNRPV